MRSKLNKKLIRDMKKSLGAYLVCVLVVTLGIIGFCSVAITRDDLTKGRADYYNQTDFADGFATMVKAPAILADTLAELPGVASVSGQIVKTCRIVSYSDQEVEMALVSLSEGGLNKPLLITGSWPQQGRSEIMVGQAFYESRNLKPGDVLQFSIDGLRYDLTVSGCGQSPEYVYIMKNAQDLLPDPLAFGIGFLPKRTMETIFDFSGSVNEFAFAMEDGAEFSAIEAKVRDILAPYGVIAVYDRDHQMSNSILQAKMDQLDRMITVLPALFLSVAGVIIYFMLRRLIQQQRNQIGVLMGFGFSKLAIVRHYVYYGAAVGFCGGLLGALFGSWLGASFLALFKEYFQIPGLSSHISLRYLLISIVVSTGFCSFTAYRAAHGVMKLRPAEAMQPEAPKETRKSLFENIPLVMGFFTAPGKMSVRSLFRNRRRSLMTVIIVFMAFDMMAFLLSMSTLIDTFIFDNLREVQKQDIRISFAAPVKIEDALRAAQVDGVEMAEPMTEVGVTIRSQTENKDASVLALPEEPQLYSLMDEKNTAVRLPESGIVLAEHLARTLAVGIGDTVELQISYPRERVSSVKVADIIPQYFGANAYMSFAALAKVSDYNNVATSLNIKGGGNALALIQQRLENAGAVNTVEDREMTVDRYTEFTDTYSYMFFVMALLGVVIAFAVIYTSSIISFEESKRDIAVLRILGMEAGEALEAISTEKWLLTLAGILIGIPLTYLTSKWAAIQMSTDLFSLPPFVSVTALFQSVLLILLAVFLSNRVIFRIIRRVVPADVLKDRE